MFFDSHALTVLVAVFFFLGRIYDFLCLLLLLYLYFHLR